MDKRWWLFAFCCVGLFVVISTDVSASATLLLGWLLDPSAHSVVNNPFFNRVNINDTLCIWNTTYSMWLCLNGSWNGTMNYNVTGTANLSYFWNNTVTLYDGSLGGYSGADALCAAEYPQTHLCSKEEMLTTIHYKSLPADWSGESWINSGAANGYHIGNPTNDCLGWTTNSASDYLGGWWDFGTGYADSVAWLINCGESKSLACCKVY